MVVYPDENECDVRFTFQEACLITRLSENNFVLVGESLAFHFFARHIKQPAKDEIDEIPPKCTVILDCTLTHICPNIALQKCPQVPTNVIGMSAVITDLESIMKKRLGCSMFTDLNDINSRFKFINEIEDKLKHCPMHPGDSVKIKPPISFLSI